MPVILTAALVGCPYTDDPSRVPVILPAARIGCPYTDDPSRVPVILPVARAGCPYTTHPETHEENSWRLSQAKSESLMAFSLGKCVSKLYDVGRAPRLHVIRAQPRQKLILFEGRADQAVLTTHDGLRLLRGLESLLNCYLLAIFVVGQIVRSCTWARRGSDIVATCVLQRCLGVLVDLAGPSTAKMDYVHTICCALLYNTQWHDDTPGAVHSEECCEALLAKLRARCKHHPDKHTADESGDLFRTMPLRQ